MYVPPKLFADFNTEYNHLLGIDKNKLLEAIKIDENKQDYYIDERDYLRYWRIELLHICRIKRDDQWFGKNIQRMKDAY